ncbi:SMP-30/Gluconolaconase/LRE-like region [Aspergillus parasiticus SU-1]|uniref:SMP-30/Gluconolaconase/LRE-like region n=1 Tax=Aspergillus parasiticus (strain ATCC 56775 / NRRL 5862 / SRRC 143 / SU-1) TaxID=1403190 RepID=A0A0F0I8K8_ASPPU|nr:SMP-30/Gluconolaconase/LRE-like region [Aspergillus parasiticus SU-1]
MASNLTFPGHPSNISQIPSAFEIHDNRFFNIIGSAPKLEAILKNDDVPFAHEASVFIPSTDELFLTSNIFTDPVTNHSTIQISKVKVNAHPVTSEVIKTTIPMANGAVNHGNGILFCGQGNQTEPSGLYQMSINAPYEAELLVSGFYGRQFNSPNDVVVHSDGSIWFTDPIYGSKQGFRPKPQLPNQVYRFEPATQNVRVVADGFGRPNGIAFSPDEKTVYITDTAYTLGDGTNDPTGPSTMYVNFLIHPFTVALPLLICCTSYAFDVSSINGEQFLTNRRVFAMADTGIPDGIKVDMDGNVYAGCGDGINIWSPGGVLLGKILIKDGAANFSFGRNGQMFILNENTLWTAQLSRSVKGALLRI